jgi:SAM-dependent methyltransferase
MGLGYTLAYRFGVTPWEAAGAGGREQFELVLDREDQAWPSRGRALDLGCGRGAHAIQLAARGWEVTGVDVVPRALEQARQRATEAGQKVTFVAGDVTDLPESIGAGYRFVLDIGCFHGLTDARRRRFGEQVQRVTVPGATMVLLAFGPGGRGPLPRGAGPDDLRAALPGWTVLDDEVADTSGMPGPLRSRAPRFYRLRRDEDGPPTAS